MVFRLWALDGSMYSAGFRKIFGALFYMVCGFGAHRCEGVVLVLGFRRKVFQRATGIHLSIGMSHKMPLSALCSYTPSTVPQSPLRKLQVLNTWLRQ